MSLKAVGSGEKRIYFCSRLFYIYRLIFLFQPSKTGVTWSDSLPTFAILTRDFFLHQRVKDRHNERTEKKVVVTSTKLAGQLAFILQLHFRVSNNINKSMLWLFWPLSVFWVVNVQHYVFLIVSLEASVWGSKSRTAQGSDGVEVS